MGPASDDNVYDRRKGNLPGLAPGKVVKVPERVDREDKTPDRQCKKVDQHPEDVHDLACRDEDENGGESASANAGVDAGKEESPAVQRSNPDEITLDDEEDEVEAPPPPPPPSTETKFLALDKCLPRRQFLEVCTRTCIAV